jgi:hypothetical protein
MMAAPAAPMELRSRERLLSLFICVSFLFRHRPLGAGFFDPKGL